jgi:hypothetical protein
MCLLMALAGLELVTAAGSSILRHLHINSLALLTGSPATVDAVRLRLGFALLGLGTGAGVGLLLLGVASARIRGEGRVCPECGALTKRIKRRRGHRILARLLQRKVARRRCGFCGWVGLSLRG